MIKEIRGILKDIDNTIPKTNQNNDDNDQPISKTKHRANKSISLNNDLVSTDTPSIIQPHNIDNNDIYSSLSPRPKDFDSRANSPHTPTSNKYTVHIEY
jgi:hypothetical protein